MSHAEGARLSPFLWRSFFARIAVPFLLTRAILLIAGFLALTQLRPPREFRAWEIGPTGDSRIVDLALPASSLSAGRYWVVNIFSRWDAEWYLGMVKHGYQYEPEKGIHSNTAFFPLYPALIWAVSRVAGDSDAAILTCGILISNLFLLLGLAAFSALVRTDFDEETTTRSALYLLVFPSTFFFSAVYTESLFFAAVVTSLLSARRGKWWLASLAGAAATLTRAPGILLFAALAVEYVHQSKFQRWNDEPGKPMVARWKPIRADVASLALIPLALAAHFAYLAWKFGSFWMFFKTEKAWGRPLVNSPDALSRFSHVAGGDVFVTLLTLACIAWGWRRLRPSYTVFAILAFLMPLASGKLLGMGRFCAIIFPLYIVLGLAGKHRTFDRYWLISSSALAVLFMALFAQWRYVG